MSTFASSSTLNYNPSPNENVMDSLFKQYERVIIESIITAFGLDMFIKDQHGGDVDTIHNVRQIGKDPDMKYKNAANQKAYESRGEYNKNKYHSDSRYRAVVNEAKKNLGNGQLTNDAYVEGNTVAPMRNNSIPRNRQGELDHVVSTKEIHDDRGRVLADLDGINLANDPGNLRYTNAALNNNMRDKTIEEYIQWCEEHPDQVNWNGKRGEPLPENVKQKLREEYARAKKEYDAKVAAAYYTSPKFWGDTAKAAGKVGLSMGLRQALGFVFTEVWFSVKAEFETLPQPFDFSDLLIAIGKGMKNGFESAKVKYKDIVAKFFSGAGAGILSSLTTTLCNIFFTTAKHAVRVIRQAYASLVEAVKVLFINPDNYLFGERMRAVAKILATGASVIVGVMVNEAIDDTPVRRIPVIGGIVSNFCGTLVTGLMTCSLLYFLDRNPLINKLVSALDKLPSISAELNYYREQAAMFEAYAAQLMEIDIQHFKAEVQTYQELVQDIDSCSNEAELNVKLKKVLRAVGVSLPWQGNFSEFMQNRNNRLVFE